MLQVTTTGVLEEVENTNDQRLLEINLLEELFSRFYGNPLDTDPKILIDFYEDQLTHTTDFKKTIVLVKNAIEKKIGIAGELDKISAVFDPGRKVLYEYYKQLDARKQKL